jgi:hypothetical protein
MAISAKQRQKKLERKAKKRKQLLAKKGVGIILSKSKAANYSNQPIHECLVPDGLFEIGLGNVIISRKAPKGNIAVSTFVVDIFCLGVKNALFRVLSEFDYDTLKTSLMASHEDQALESIHPACARKLLEGAVAYAEELGFSCHPDYVNAKGIFGDIDPSSCPVKYTYGKDGKPFYIRGPNETMAEAQRIINQLYQRCGEGGFDYLMMIDEGF